MKTNHLLLIVLVLFVAIFVTKPPDSPKKQKKYFTEVDLIPHRYPASLLQIFLNKGYSGMFFVSNRAQMYKTIVDKPRMFLSKYPLAYTQSTLVKGSCFFGSKIGTRIYTKFHQDGEVYFDQENLYCIDSLYHYALR